MRCSEVHDEGNSWPACPSSLPLLTNLPSVIVAWGMAWGMACAGLAWPGGPDPGRFIHAHSKGKVGWAALAGMARTVHRDGAKPALLCTQGG